MRATPEMVNRRRRPERDRRYEVRVFGSSFQGGRYRQASLRAAFWRARQEIERRELCAHPGVEVRASIVDERKGRVWRVA